MSEAGRISGPLAEPDDWPAECGSVGAWPRAREVALPADLAGTLELPLGSDELQPVARATMAAAAALPTASQSR
ncbi:MAG TPA: hypothetical protein VMA73_27420 [Streptosporangiaceae bacterium]|nr:hypothetical protein [Streptosporangiaceae bacterium]